MQSTDSSSMTSSTPDYVWEDIVDAVKDGRVVPVIGPELLVGTFDGDRKEHFYSFLARQLAAERGLPYDDTRPKGDLMNEVLSAIPPEKRKESEWVYPCIRVILQRLLERQIPPPPALQKLAEITNIKVFINLTYCPLLEQALVSARGTKVDRLIYSPGSGAVADIDTDIEDLERPLVYYLMGFPTDGRPRQFAVTPEDVVEFIHSLHNKVPTKLFQDLRRRHLLLIGCNYPDWLTRFFLRIMKNDRLRIPNDEMQRQRVVDSVIHTDVDLRSFVDQFCSGIDVNEEYCATDFVDKLHARWLKKQPVAGIEQIPIADAQPDGVPEMTRGYIFLSYASEDAIAARKLRLEFEKESLLVWMDETDLPPGSKWRKKISDNIEKSAVFIPLISVHTGSYGFFREEWERGITRSRLFRTPFLFPVVIDDANIEENEDIPDEFKEAQVARCRDGVPTKSFLDAVATAQKMNQKAMERT